MMSPREQVLATTVGGRSLAAALGVLAAIQVASQFALFLERRPYFLVDPTKATLLWLSWVLLITIFVSAATWLRTRNGYLSKRVCGTALVSVGGVVIVELWATWGSLSNGVLPTATIAAGAVLAPLAALRSPRFVAVATSVLAVTLATWVASQSVERVGPWLSQGVGAILWAIIPGALAVVIVTGFREDVREQIDLTMTNATLEIANPIGSRESRLLSDADAAAQEILERVANGQEVSNQLAAEANEVSRQLRALLVESERSTWLNVAIEESDYLRSRVIAQDAEANANLLSVPSRTSLLLALWQLAGMHQRSDAMVHLSFPETQGRTGPDGRAGQVRFKIDTHLTRRRIPPSTWRTLERMGSVTARRGPHGMLFSLTVSYQPDELFTTVAVNREV